MYYYYDKNYYGQEHCYEVADDELRKDKENTLEDLVNGELYPVWHLESWDDLDWDPDDEYDRWLAKTITNFLSPGRTLPVIVITHFTSKPDERYECCNTEDEIDYDELIREYAGPKGYRKDPEYIKEGEYTAETAEKCGMYALAKLLREKEREVEEKQMDRKEQFIQDLKAVDLSQPPEFAFEIIYNLVWDYQKDTKKYTLDVALENFLNSESAYDKYHDKVEDLEDAWRFVGCLDYMADWYRLSEYGQLMNIDKKDLEVLIEDIIERLED